MILFKDFCKRYNLRRSDYYRLQVLKIFPNTIKVKYKVYITESEVKKYDKRFHKSSEK